MLSYREGKGRSSMNQTGKGWGGKQSRGYDQGLVRCGNVNTSALEEWGKPHSKRRAIDESDWVVQLSNCLICDNPGGGQIRVRRDCLESPGIRTLNIDVESKRW